MLAALWRVWMGVQVFQMGRWIFCDLQYMGIVTFTSIHCQCDGWRVRAKGNLPIPLVDRVVSQGKSEECPKMRFREWLPYRPGTNNLILEAEGGVDQRSPTQLQVDETRNNHC